MSNHEETLLRIEKEQKFRISLARESFYWFFIIYFNHYVKYPMAKFQKEIFEIVSDKNVRFAIIMAFRGSAKSTIVTFAYVIWSILGKQKNKMVLIVCSTQQRAQEALTHIRQEFEKENLLNFDFGPFIQDDLWKDNTLALTKYKAKIIAVSTNENIRGIRNEKYRPDIIICDDVEDVQSAKTKEGRDKIWQFLNSEVFPAGDVNTKKIVVGNLVGEDSVMFRFKKVIDEGKLNGVFRAYPLVTKDGKIMWPEKFKNLDDIEKFKKTTVANEIDWQREYLLNIVANADQVILREWMHYYEETALPSNYHLYETSTGVDLAISKKESADNTALVSGSAYKINLEPSIYILPNPINKRMSFPDTILQIKELNKFLGGRSSNKFYIESVAYQAALAQQLRQDSIYVEEVHVVLGKRERLVMVSHWIKDGKILFPRHGCEQLIEQILGFGIESHDDLVDAFTILCSKLIDRLTQAEPWIAWFDETTSIFPHSISGGEPYHPISFNKIF